MTENFLYLYWCDGYDDVFSIYIYHSSQPIHYEGFFVVVRAFYLKKKEWFSLLEPKLKEASEEYNDMVDNVINTSSIYEIGVLKVILEPLLLNVPLDSEHYTDARRLLDSIRNFYPISSEYVSKSSILREFIGGSIYDVK